MSSPESDHKQLPLIARVHGLWQSLVIAAVLALASTAGFFTPVDGLVYDLLVRNSPDLKAGSREVLLIDTPVAAFFDPALDWVKVVDELRGLGASQVVFTVIPEGSRGITDQLLRNPGVVLGADLAPDPQRVDEQRFNLPPAMAGFQPNSVSEVTDPLLGLHRYQRYSYQVNGQSIPSLEAMTARRLGVTVPESGRYLVDFSDDSGGLPRIRLQQVLQGKLIRDIVQKRVVLIGIGNERFHRAVVTPITDAGREVSKLEYHGYALDSLLRKTSIGSLHPLAKALLVLSVWLAFLLIAQPMTFRKAVIAGTLMATALVTLAWLLLLTQHLHLPIVASILVIGTTLVSVVQSKAGHHNRALQRLVNQANLAAEGRFRGQLVPADDGFWPHLLGMVDQVVPLTRAVLLERLSGTTQLAVVASLRCSMDAVVDPRRDLELQPYQSAVKDGGAVELQGFLQPLPGQEQQFLAPLMSDGEVVGFLATGLAGGEEPNLAAVKRSLAVLGPRLAELMLDRRERAALESASAPPRWGGLRTDRRNDTVTRLATHFLMAQRHAQLLEDTFDRLETPAMVYDLFGRPLIANAGMKTLLKDGQLHAQGGLAAADLIERACGLSPEQSRTALARVAFDGATFEHAAWLGSMRYQLKAVALREATSAGVSGAGPAQDIHGFMLQLFAQGLAPVEQLPAAAAAAQGGQDVDQEVDLWQALETSIAKVAELPDFELLEFELDARREPAVVRTEPAKLGELLTALIHLLAYDSKLPGTLNAEIAMDGPSIRLTLRNAGFGMPNDRLQAMLDGPTWPQSPSLRRIRQLRDNAMGPRGQLKLTSAVGSGYCAEAILPRIQ